MWCESEKSFEQISLMRSRYYIYIFMFLELYEAVVTCLSWFPFTRWALFAVFFLSKNYSLPFNINNYKLELMGSSKWEVLFKRSDLQMLARSWKISMEEHFCKKCCRLATINGIKNEPFYNYFAHNVSEFWKHKKKEITWNASFYSRFEVNSFVIEIQHRFIRVIF